MCGEYLLIGENGAWKMPSKGLTAESLPIQNPKWRWNGVKFNSNVRSMPVPVVVPFITFFIKVQLKKTQVLPQLQD